MARRFDKPPIVVERPPDLHTISLAELLSMKFDAPAWVIPGLLPVGLTILAAPPKTGKSLLSLGLVLRVAYYATSAGLARPDGQAQSGLYLSLDDPSERRLQTRVLDILDGRPLEHGAYFTTTAASLDDGLCIQLRTWLRVHVDVKIIVVDALATVKAKRSGDDVFKSDYSGLKGLQQLALECGIAVLLVHHTRKMPAGDDWVNRISGTLGVAAMADALWLLERPRGATKERLLITSRDAPDTVLEVPLDDLLEGVWLPSGEDSVKETFLMDQVLAAIKEAGTDGISAKAVAKALNLKPGQVMPQVQRLHQSGHITRLRYGQYTASLYRVAPAQATPGLEPPEGDNAARLYRVAQVPPAQAAKGFVALCNTLCDTVFSESAPGPDGNRYDAQSCNPIQPSGNNTGTSAANPDGNGPEAQLLHNHIQPSSVTSSLGDSEGSDGD